MRHFLFVIALSLVLPAVAFAEAQPDIETDAPRVFSIQPRPYRLGHEFSLGLGVLPLDAFYKGAVIGAGYTYHFSDFWAWEMANLNYSLNVDTGLEGELLDKYGVRPVDAAGGRITLIGTTNLVVKPLFGKFSAFNISKVFAETYFVAGGGPIRLERDGRGTFYFAADLGVGIRFWVAKAFSMRFDVRDYLIFNDGVIPTNALMFMLGASFNYWNGDDHKPVTSSGGVYQ